MKFIKRYYYLLRYPEFCFKMSLNERIEQMKLNYYPINSFRHCYLGNDWWLDKFKLKNI